MSKVEERLAAAGITIPEVPVPLAAYVPGVVSGNMVHTPASCLWQMAHCRLRESWETVHPWRMAMLPQSSVPSTAWVL